MELDPLLLSRLQFTWVIAWHILLPAFTIGLASYIAFLEGLYFITRREIYFRISSMWIKIFAISFGMGVVSGVVMPFQFGTNWSRFADATANVLSPLFAYEALMAFFLEATFLGILLFGRSLVPRWGHFIAAIMVALGTLLSAFWIIAANSWMQTPAGATMENGLFQPVSWMQIIFNPSFPFRLAHTVIGFYVTTGFVVLGVAAYFLLRRQFIEEATAMLSATLWLLTLFVPLQFVIGHLHGDNTLEYQPAKLAAIEANWERQPRAPLMLFAWPDETAEVNRFALEVPLLGSLILADDPDGVIPGLKDFPREDRPPVAIVFFAFRIMFGIALLFLAIVLVGQWLRYRGRLHKHVPYLRSCVAAAPLGFIAVLAGWTITEVGRQPWTVYGLVRTADSVTPSLSGVDVLLSLVGYMIAYLVIFPAGVFFMARVLRKGPADSNEVLPVEAGQHSRPVALSEQRSR